MNDQVKFTQDDINAIEADVLKSTLTLTLSVKEMNIILGLLGKYPFDEVNLMIENIHAQCQPQVQDTIQALEKAKLEEIASATA